MTLIERFMPSCSLRQVDRLAVRADPVRAWQVVRAVDLAELAFARWLFMLRVLPDRALARLRSSEPPPPLRSRIDDIAGPGSGFLRLAEEPGREVVVGSVGHFWQPSIPFAAVTADTFAAFAEPGWGKLAWSLRVDPRTGGGAWVSFDLRVDATDAKAWRRFGRYWRLIGPFSHAIRRALLKRFAGELGLAAPDAERVLPGDNLLPSTRFDRTHAITIEAPPAEVWPWLVQMGCHRAGWYSWDLLDNGGVPSADRIVPGLQSLAVGDLIPANPERPGDFAVLRLEPERALVLGSPALLPGAPLPTGAPPWRSTWTFALEPIGDDATRLFVRVRADYVRGFKMALAKPFMATLHEVMERRQIANLRRRIEAST
ncbi:MAG: SRPBCC family protein [Myxococcota bacterium]